MEVIQTERPYDRALRLPVGLTVKEAAEFIGVSSPTARKLLKAVHYKAVDRRKETKSTERRRKQWVTDWTKVDWTLRDCEIAKQIGVSRTSVAKRRKELT